MFISVFWGGHLKFKEVRNLKGKEISICLSQSVPVHADGEDVGETPIHIRYARKAGALSRNSGSILTNN